MARVFRALPSKAPYNYISSIAGPYHSVHTSLPPPSTIICRHDLLDVARFQELAFRPEVPVLITESTDHNANTAVSSPIPAVHKWFEIHKLRVKGGFRPCYSLKPSYINQFKDVFLPYELVAPPLSLKMMRDPLHAFRKYIQQCGHEKDVDGELHIEQYLPTSDEGKVDRMERFYTFYGPLQLFLLASRRERLPPVLQRSDTTPDENDKDACRLQGLYIAQAQLSVLPQEMREDLPTPKLVELAGKGDIYDANLWLGTSPTYTPLHKDPNPNFFVQLAGNKLVRLFKPLVGRKIFYSVREQIGSPASETFRGEEMMMGSEREMLERAVWDCSPFTEGFEVMVRPGDALFIPKGWWHSIKSVNTDVTASVNWWFR